jgi:hypothetical protein
MAGRGNGKIGGCVRCLVCRGYGRLSMTVSVFRSYLRCRNCARAVLLLTFSLAACVTWVKPGVPPEVRDRDLAQCQSLAYSRVPPDVRTVMISPAYIAPPATLCTEHHRETYCQYTPGYYVPPDYANVDANDSARSAQVYSCMSRLGYVQRASL